MDDRTQPLLKTKFRDVIFPDFPDDENTVTTTVTKSRRVSFGTNLVKEFIVGSAVSAQCVSEYEQAFSSSDSSNANSSYSAVESGILDQNTFVVEEKSKILQPIPPPSGSNIPDGEILDRTQSKRPKFGSTICFSADSPTADMEFTEGCLTLAKSILEKKNKEMTVIIQAKPKEEEKTKDDETKYFEGSQFDMSMTKCFKSKENKREEKRFDDEKTRIFSGLDDDMSMTKCFKTKENKRFDDEKTRIFSSQDDDMSMTKCDKLFRMRQVEMDDDSDENMEDESKENQIPLDLIMRHLDKDKDNTDFEKFLFHPQKSLSDVLNAVSLDLSNDSEKLNLNESMDISRDFQSELPKVQDQPSTEEKTVGREDKLSLNVTKTIEEQVFVSSQEIILRKEHLVLVQREGESLTGIRTAYESSEEEKEEPEDAEMEITLTGSGNVISNVKEERSNEVEVTKETEMKEEASKALKNTADEVIEKAIINEKIDEDTDNQESEEMDVETETKEMSLEVAKEQTDVREEENKEETEDENKVVVNSQELSFSRQREESVMDVSTGQISENVDATEEKETKGSLNLSEGITDNIETPSVEPEEQKDSTELLMTPEVTEEEEKREELNMSDMEMTLAKGKKEMSFNDVLKEITKDHEAFDEKVLEKYFEKDPEGDTESFLEKDMEDVEMQLDLEELNDDSVNKSVVSSKGSPKSSERVPARESIAKPEESEKVEREPPPAMVGVKMQMDLEELNDSVNKSQVSSKESPKDLVEVSVSESLQVDKSIAKPEGSERVERGSPPAKAKVMEDVEMQLDLEEINDDSVNKIVMPSKGSPKSSVRVPARESIRFDKSKAKPEERKESEGVEIEPPPADAKVIESLKEQSEESHCVWTLGELSYREKENEKVGFMSFNLKLLESSTTIKFRLKGSEEEGLCAWSAISSAEIELNPDGEPKTKDYKTTVMFGYEIQRKYFLEEKKMAKTTQHIPYFLDKMNSFNRKLHGYLDQIHLILSSFPGSRLKGSVFSFRLFSFPLLLSSTVSIDLTDLFRLSKSSLSFNTELGSLDENEMKEIFEKNLSEGGPPLYPSVMAMTKRIIAQEIEETGRVSKRDHIPLLNGISLLEKRS